MNRTASITCGALTCCFVVAVVVTFLTVPITGKHSSPVDTILVLGAPATMDGHLSRQQNWRVSAAVREWRTGQAPFLLFSGGAAANRFVEADVMAAYAMQLGVPPSAILKEREAQTTVQNLANSERIMAAHGWTGLEVVTSPDHARRAAVLLEDTCLTWRVVPAATPGRNPLEKAAAYVEEAVATALLRWFGPGAESGIHRVARVLQAIEHWIRQRTWEVKHRPFPWFTNSRE